MLRKEFQAVFRLKFLLAFLAVAVAVPASAQLTHVDSVLAGAIAPMIPAVNGVPARLAGDSSILLLSGAMSKPPSNAPIFYISSLSATAKKVDTGTQIDISMQGDLMQDQSSYAVPRTLARTVVVSLSETDWNMIQNNGSRFVHTARPGGFWSNVLEPALVIVGAAAVVALFFLIRS